jgi:hypothetical protein
MFSFSPKLPKRSANRSIGQIGTRFRFAVAPENIPTRGSPLLAGLVIDVGDMNSITVDRANQTATRFGSSMLPAPSYAPAKQRIRIFSGACKVVAEAILGSRPSFRSESTRSTRSSSSRFEWQPSHAGEALANCQVFAPTAPDELGCIFAIDSGPNGSPACDVAVSFFRRILVNFPTKRTCWSYCAPSLPLGRQPSPQNR